MRLTVKEFLNTLDRSASFLQIDEFFTDLLDGPVDHLYVLEDDVHTTDCQGTGGEFPCPENETDRQARKVQSHSSRPHHRPSGPSAYRLGEPTALDSVETGDHVASGAVRFDVLGSVYLLADEPVHLGTGGSDRFLPRDGHTMQPEQSDEGDEDEHGHAKSDDP